MTSATRVWAWPGIAPRTVASTNAIAEARRMLLPLQCEDIQHGRVALLLEFRRVDELGLGGSTWPRRDRQILLAVDLEGHRRRAKARADIDLPQFVERGVVERRNRAVQQPEEDQSAGGGKRARVVRVAQVHALLDLAGHRVDGGQVAFKAFRSLAEAAVPASFLVVFLPVDRHVYAGRQGRNVEELGVGVVGRRPVIVTAGLGRAKLLERLSGV